MKFNLKNAVIRGTIILTAAGILSRIIGFFYRIYLTHAIGAEGMGLFQLVTPLIGIAFAVCSAGIQTGISRFCAAKDGRNGWLFAGLILSIPISVVFAGFLYINADLVAGRILLNPTCAPLIRLLAFSFPFSSLHNCVNGYYFGRKETGVPAFSQLFEQVIRVLTVYAYASYCAKTARPVTVICALYGNLTGELASSLFCVAALFFGRHVHLHFDQIGNKVVRIFKFSVPLSANRLLMHLLQSGEAILIPAQLLLYGYSSSEALSLYGILTGMALPLIMFPTAITNALSVMLLPEVSGAQSAHNERSIIKTLNRSVRLCMMMGIMSTLLFLFYGGRLGAIIFGEPAMQSFILILAWLCPFIYLTTTLASVLNGLGRTTLTCVQNILCVLLRIAFLILFVPKYGIAGYLWGLLVSQVFICLAHYVTLSRMFHLKMNPYGHILSPLFYSVLSVGLSLLVMFSLDRLGLFSELLRLTVCAGAACLIFLLLIRRTFLRPAD